MAVKHRTDVSLERLKEVLQYDSEIGDFFWRVTRARNFHAGSRASPSVNAQGYRHIMVDQISYKAHRLAWFYIHGNWPNADIYHINGVRHDNSICNLRAISRSDNIMNSRKRFDGKTSRYRGVCFQKQYGKWVAQYKNKILGYFNTEEEAHEAYLAEARNHIRILPLHPDAERIAQS